MGSTEPWSQPTETIPTIKPKASSQRRQSRNGSVLRTYLPLVGISVFLCAFLLLAVSVGYSYYYRSKIYPNVYSLGINLGGMTPEQARQALNAKAMEYVRTPLVLTQGEHTWKITPAELGLQPNVDPAVQQAYNYGRNGNIFHQFAERIPIGRRTVRIQYVLDKSKIDNYVNNKLAPQIARPATDSKLTVSGDGTILASKEVDGQKLNTSMAIQQIYNALVNLRKGDIALPVVTVKANITQSTWRDRQKLVLKLSKPVTLRFENRSWTITSDEIEQAIVAESGAEGVVGKIEPSKLMPILADINKDIALPPEPAKLDIKDNQVALTPEQPGRRLDYSATLSAIYAALQSSGETDLVTKEIEPIVTTSVLENARSQLEKLLASPLKLHFKDQSWEIPTSTLADWASIDIDKANRTSSVKLDPNKVNEFVDNLASEINQNPINGELTWRGKLVVLRESQDGQDLDTEKTKDLIAQAAFSDDRDIDLPVKVTKPKIPTDNLAALGIKESIGWGSSEFTGSPPERVHNIQTAAGYLNNAVVAPGETFSFEKAIGEISVERGYQEGLTIVADQTVPGIGGGVCQVSTTMFRAAFWAGLPIVERHQHSYLVPYYQLDGDPPGFDAAVYFPYKDLKWKNTTGHYILIEATWTDTKLTITLYGTDPGYEVTRGKPVITNIVPPLPDKTIYDPTLPPGTKEQVDWAHEGMDVTITRTVTKNGKVVLQDSFFSRYKPWGNIYRVGPPKKEPSKKEPPKKETKNKESENKDKQQNKDINNTKDSTKKTEQR